MQAGEESLPTVHSLLPLTTFIIDQEQFYVSADDTHGTDDLECINQDDWMTPFPACFSSNDPPAQLRK